MKYGFYGSIYGGVRGLKFGDLLIVVASMTVVVAFICTPLNLAFVSALGLQSGYP